MQDEREGVQRPSLKLTVRAHTTRREERNIKKITGYFVQKKEENRDSEGEREVELGEP